MGWWITLGILVLLAVLPLGVSVRYDEDGALVRLIAGPVKITLFPRPKKVKKPKKEKKKKAQNPEEPAPAPKPRKKKKKAAAANRTATANAGSSARQTQSPQQTVPGENSQPSGQNPQSSAQNPQPSAQAAADEPEQKKKKGGSLLDFLPLVGTVFDFLGDFRRRLRVNLLEMKIVLAGGDPCDLAVNYGRAWAALSNLLPRLERFLKIQKRDLDVQCDFTASQTTIYARLDLTITLGRLLAAVFAFLFRALVEFIKIMIKRKGGTEK